MSKATSYEIAPNLFLVRQELSQGTTAPQPSPTNHLAVIDVSGSMSNDLPKIREQLKKRLPVLLGEGDTFSLVWFSGRGEFGVLFEGESVETLKDLQRITQTIDRWLRPIGLTGFKEPLQEAAGLAARVAKKNKNPFALFFMSDGCDNQWQRADILKTLDSVGASIAAATFVEYGYYADRQLLTLMAEKCGGSLIFADGFDDYAPKFEQKLQQRATADRVTVKIEGDPIGGFAFSLDTEKHEIMTYGLTSPMQISVASDVREVWHLSPSKVGDGDALTRYIRRARFGGTTLVDDPCIDAAYAAMSLFAVRMKPDVVYPILKALGDVAFINLFAGCFGKQKYTEFMQTARAAAFYPDVRLREGYDPNKVPADDAFTVLDLLHTLLEDDETRLLLERPEFEYSRISRARVDADENFYVAEQEKLDELKLKLAATKKPAEVKAVQAEIDVLVAKKRDALKFIADSAPDGYPLQGLTYNENRANISLKVMKKGTVDLRGRTALMDGTERVKLPVSMPLTFPTHIWRNYAIVVDGLVNIKTLPAIVSKTTYGTLKAYNVRMRLIGDSDLPTCTVVIDVGSLPIINRSMVGSCSAAELIEAQYELCEAKAYQKVYNAVAEALPPCKPPALADRYDDYAAAWLKDQGITDNGFSPLMAVAESKDFYLGKKLEVKLKGYSTLPKVVDAKAGKGGAPGKFMKAALSEIAANEAAHQELPAKHFLWVEQRQKQIVQQTRKLMEKMAQQKFTIIVGQVWPKEFASVDENTLKVKIGDVEVTGTLEMSEVEVHI